MTYKNEIWNLIWLRSVYYPIFKDLELENEKTEMEGSNEDKNERFARKKRLKSILH